MYYVVALGNPGAEYEHNRHNVGFKAVDFILNSLAVVSPENSNEYLGKHTKGMLGEEAVNFLYPETFMNHCGQAVRKFVPDGEFCNLIVLYDDVALPLGEIKISFDRGDGGHNGIKSIINSLGSKAFVRVRIGVAATSFWTGKIKPLSGEALPKFVLSNFSTSEKAKLKEEVFPKVLEAVTLTVQEGYAKAMNVFN